MNSKILIGDAKSKLKEIKSGSVDCVITDPPYGISYLGNKWDVDVPSIDIFKECYRTMKPGSFAFVMSSPRQDVLSRMIENLEQAGLVINYTSLYWAYSSGMPKASNIYNRVSKSGRIMDSIKGAFAGFNPKPAVEVIIVAMKPLEKKNYTEQCLDNMKGVTWLSDCQIPVNGSDTGRFPANIVVSDDALNDGRVFKTSGSAPKMRVKGFFVRPKTGEYIEVKKTISDSGSFSKYFDLDAWFSERVKELPEPVRTTYPFLLVSKPSQAEKHLGGHNIHPTVKPIKLMAYLVTLGSREGDLILDPFCGSGTTGIAASLLSRRFIGIDLSPEHADISRRRIKAARPEHLAKIQTQTNSMTC